MNSENLKTLVENALDDMKGKDPACLEVKESSSFADYMIVVTGTSNRHVKSLAEGVMKQAKDEGLIQVSVEGMEQGDWVLIDLGDVLAHIMLPDTRQLYDLESLWELGSTREEQ